MLYELAVVWVFSFLKSRQLQTIDLHFVTYMLFYYCAYLNYLIKHILSTKMKNFNSISVQVQRKSVYFPNPLKNDFKKIKFYLN